MIFPTASHPLNNIRRLDEPGAVAPGFSSILEVVYGGWFLNIREETVLLFSLFIFITSPKTKIQAQDGSNQLQHINY